MNHLNFNKIFTAAEKGKACDLLAEASGLSKSRIKRAMSKGAVWLGRGGTKQRRIRRATYEIRPGDQLALYYDEAVLSRKAPDPVCIKDFKQYSVWFKPSGLLTQGTRHGDHCALTRQAEAYFKPRRNIFIVHRIDRETAGLVLLCHNPKAASRFSGLFQRREIEKCYDVRVRGDLRCQGEHGEIRFSLDGKTTRTRYQCISYNPDTNESRVHAEIMTGRTHQIRRHFDMIGHPVVGDPRYGDRNKNRTGLRLVAKSLAFIRPFKRRPISIRIDPENLPTPPV